jgi:DNA-binding transcriptional regulator YhcF (GntR family)
VQRINTNAFQKLISIDYQSATPKYRQLANSILKAIRHGLLHKDDVLPSINELSFMFEISRDTAEKGYKHLKEAGVLGSVPGKGFFIVSTALEPTLKIFLLFNKLSAHKKIIYDAFMAALPESAWVDFYVYNNDFAYFKKLIGSKKEDYSHYVIIPHFIEGEEQAPDVINAIDKTKLVLLDKLLPGVQGKYAAVYENFERDIRQALTEALPGLSKYQTIKLIFPENSYYPKEIVRGFLGFCAGYNFKGCVISDISAENPAPGEVYINLMENDLVTLIEKIVGSRLQIGKDVGVISYNETALKKIILQGITTISTDFQMMGRRAAELITTGSNKHVEIPFYLTLRHSL